MGRVSLSLPSCPGGIRHLPAAPPLCRPALSGGKAPEHCPTGHQPLLSQDRLELTKIKYPFDTEPHDTNHGALDGEALWPLVAEQLSLSRAGVHAPLLPHASIGIFEISRKLRLVHERRAENLVAQ